MVAKTSTEQAVASSNGHPLDQIRLAAKGDRLVFQITADARRGAIHIVRTLHGDDGVAEELACGFDEAPVALNWVDDDPARFECPRLMTELKEVIGGLFEQFSSNRSR